MIKAEKKNRKKVEQKMTETIQEKEKLKMLPRLIQKY